MSSRSKIQHLNSTIIDIKKEETAVLDQPVIINIQNYQPEVSDSTIKAEPEENYCMEVDQHNEFNLKTSGFSELHTGGIRIINIGGDESFINNVEENNKSNGSFLKIESIAQGYYDIFDKSKQTVKGKLTKNAQKGKKTNQKIEKTTKKSSVIHQTGVKRRSDSMNYQSPASKKAKIDVVPKKLSKVEKFPSGALKSEQILTKNMHVITNAPNNVNFTKVPKQSSSNKTKNSKLSTKASNLQQNKSVKTMKSNRKQPKIKINANPEPQKKSINVKTESRRQLLVKPEPVDNSIIIPDHIPVPDHIKMIDYEPKPLKKRRQLQLECDHCGKVFKSKYSIIWHMKEHMTTMPFNCDICGKGFSYERSFKQHELSHAAKVKCEICNKQLKPHAMYYHMKYKHTNEKAHQCPLCPKKFKTKDNISRHMMRHNMDYECHICNRRFAENSRLQMHLSMHENPEAFYCSICCRTFEHIDRHVKRLHTNKRERNFKCKYCEYASDSKQTVRRHEEMHEKRNEVIKSKSKNKKDKLKKVTLKQFVCKVCNVVLQTKCGYKSHLRHYHKGKEPIKEEPSESREESSVESDNFVEVKVEKEEIRAVQ